MPVRAVASQEFASGYFACDLPLAPPATLAVPPSRRSVISAGAVRRSVSIAAALRPVQGQLAGGHREAHCWPCEAMTCEAHTGLAGRRPPGDALGRGDGRGARPDLPWGVCRRQGRAGGGLLVGETFRPHVEQWHQGDRGGEGLTTVTQGEVGGSVRAAAPRWGNRFPHGRRGLLLAAAARARWARHSAGSLGRAGCRQTAHGRRVPGGGTVSPTSGAGDSGMCGRGGASGEGRVDRLPRPVQRQPAGRQGAWQDDAAARAEARRVRPAGWRGARVSR